MIHILPDDVKKKIYYEYFDFPIKYERLMKLFQIQCSKRNIPIIYQHLRTTNLLNNTKLLDYIMERSVSFKYAYINYAFGTTRYTYINDEVEGFALFWTIVECH